MAQYWLRGPQAEKSGANHFQNSRGNTVLLYFYLRYLLGMNYVDTKSVLFDYDGCEAASGTADGSLNLTGTDYKFTAPSSIFTIGVHEGQFLVIKDPSNPANCGIYEITSVLSGTEVVIDFYSTDYPITANGTLDWWLVDSEIGENLIFNEGFVFDATHASGAAWTLHCFLLEDGANDRLAFDIAVGADKWDAVAHEWKAGNTYYKRLSPVDGYYSTQDPARLYVYGDTDFDMFFMCYQLDGGVGNKTFMGWCVLDPIYETGHTAQEMFYNFGMEGNDQNQEGDRDDVTNYSISHGNIYYETQFPGMYTSKWCGWYGYSGSGITNYELFKQSNAAPNHRHGTDFDGLPIWVHLDANVSPNSVWQLIGALPKTHIWLTNCDGIGDLVTFGSDNYLHITEGITIPWPGIARD